MNGKQAVSRCSCKKRHPKTSSVGMMPCHPLEAPQHPHLPSGFIGLQKCYYFWVQFFELTLTLGCTFIPQTSHTGIWTRTSGPSLSSKLLYHTGYQEQEPRLKKNILNQSREMFGCNMFFKKHELWTNQENFEHTFYLLLIFFFSLRKIKKKIKDWENWWHASRF